MNHLKDVIYQRNTFTRGQLKHLPIISSLSKGRLIISSSLREVSTWHFCEQIARSKKTPALQATIHKIIIIDLFKFYSVKKN